MAVVRNRTGEIGMGELCERAGGSRDGDLWVEQKCWWVALAFAVMERTTNKKTARARLLEVQAAAAAERVARERQNIEDLAMFMVSTAKADGVDEWLDAQIEKVREQAAARRLKFRGEAGKALQAMRFRGETVSGIAAQAGITPARVREYLKLVAADGAAGTESGDNVGLENGSAAVPTDDVAAGGGQEGVRAAVGAQ